MINKEADILESLIDKYGVSEVLHAIACICYEKAEHIRVNWQDYGSQPINFDKVGNLIGAMADRIYI